MRMNIITDMKVHKYISIISNYIDHIKSNMYNLSRLKNECSMGNNNDLRYQKCI